MPVPTPISPTVGPAEGVSVFGGQGVGLQRSGCRFGAAYALNRLKIKKLRTDTIPNKTALCIKFVQINNVPQSNNNTKLYDLSEICLRIQL